MTPHFQGGASPGYNDENGSGNRPLEEVTVIGYRDGTRSGQSGYDYLSGLAWAGAFGPGQIIQFGVGVAQVAAGVFACSTVAGCVAGGPAIAFGLRDIGEAITGKDVVVESLTAIGLDSTGAKGAAAFLDLGNALLPVGGAVKAFTGQLTKKQIILNTSVALGGSVDLVNDISELTQPNRE